MLRNNETHYGAVAIALHWSMALVLAGLFMLGLWMTGLDYYDPWYKRAPELHKGIGVLLFAALVLRLAWRVTTPLPQTEARKPWEGRLAALTHGLMYLLMFAVMVAGYLISTADGRPIEVFGWFSIPATLSGMEQQEDVAGSVHEWLAYSLMGLATSHALAALKHHFIDRDRTLQRMLGR